MALGWMSFGIFLYYTTLFVLTIRKEPPLTAVAKMVAVVIGCLFATASVGIFILRVRAEYTLRVDVFILYRQSVDKLRELLR